MASDITMNDQNSNSGGLAQLFVAADAAIERRRVANIFKQLDERSLTQEEERIIQQRVELQRKLLEEYERREQKRKVSELQDMWPELTEVAALRALEFCNGKEDEAVLRLTEDAAFKRRVMAETGTYTPITVIVATKGSTSRSSSSRLRPERAGAASSRSISPSKLEGNVFVGRFRSKLGPYQEQALADAAAARAAAAAAASGQPQPKKRGRPKKRKDPPADAAAAQAGDLDRAATLAAAASATGAATSPPKRRSTGVPNLEAAAASDYEPQATAAAAAADSGGLHLQVGGSIRERSSSPSDAEQEAEPATDTDLDQAPAASAEDYSNAAAPNPGRTPGNEPSHATTTDCGTDVDAPQPSVRKRPAATFSQAAAAERVSSMMARQVARLEPLLAAERLLDFELRRPGASKGVLDLLAAEYGEQVSGPIATAWEVLLEEQKWKEAEELAAYEAHRTGSKDSSSRTGTAAAAFTASARLPSPAAESPMESAEQQQPEQQQPLEQPTLEQQQDQLVVVQPPADIAAALAAAAALTTEVTASGTVQYCGCGCGLPLEAAAAAPVSHVPNVLDPAAAPVSHIPEALNPAAATVSQVPDALDPAALAAAPVDVLPAVGQQQSSWLPQHQGATQHQPHQQWPMQQQRVLPGLCSIADNEQQQQQLKLDMHGSKAGELAVYGQHAVPSAAGDIIAGNLSDASTETNSPATAAAVGQHVPSAADATQEEAAAEQPQRRSKRAAAVTGVSAAVAAAAAGVGKTAVASSRASRAISETGHTCRGRVRQKSHKTTELVELGKLVPNPHWFNAGYIFPAGFKSRLLFRSSVDLEALCLHECEIVGEGGAYWPAPTFVVTARDREDEPIVAKSCTGCWTGILKRINAVITKRIAEGEALPPPPRTAIAGPEYFGLNDEATIAAIEALDPQHLCTTYWIGKEQREAAAAGMPVAVQPRGGSSKGSRGSGSGTGRKRGRGRSGAADGDDEGEEALGYKGSKWSSISRRERYIKRCADAGEEAPISEEQQLLPGVLDPITLEPVVNPAISPAGHVMGLATWKAVLAENPRCPFTKAPLRPDMLTVLTVNNIERYRDRIIAMT